MQVTVDHSKAVEARWFKMRAGRITASKFKVHAALTQLIFQRDCQYAILKFIDLAMKQQSGDAIMSSYVSLEINSHRSQHENVKVSKCGLLLALTTLFLEPLQTALSSVHAVEKEYVK